MQDKVLSALFFIAFIGFMVGIGCLVRLNSKNVPREEIAGLKKIMKYGFLAAGAFAILFALLLWIF